MTTELFSKIIDEAISIPTITEVCLTGLGEPTLDPRLVDRVKYIHSRKESLPISIFTNGVYLHPHLFDRLANSGMTHCVISLNAVRPEQHESIMGLKGKFNTVCNNTDYAIEYGSGVSVEVHAVLCEDKWTFGDVETFYARWGHRNRGGNGVLVYEGNWAGGTRTVRPIPPNECCYRALSQIYVMFDGKISTCCFDPTGKQVFGDLTTESLREAYASASYLKFREMHSQNKADAYSICKTCTRI